MIGRRPEEVVADVLDLDGRWIVDLGCGDGWLTRFLASRGAVAVGVDPSPAMLARARAEAGPESFVRARADDLPLRDGSVDAAVFLNSLHHVPPERQSRALAEAARVVVRGGRVLVIEPLAEGDLFETMRLVEDETEVRAHAERVVRQASGCGLAREREVVFATPLSFPDYAAFRDRLVAVDEGRLATLEAVEPRLEARFLERAVRRGDGYHFDQPQRAFLLRKGP